ncbi:MAG: hypothetical protein AAF587_34690 [Bacteroidota bacterium]
MEDTFFNMQANFLFHEKNWAAYPLDAGLPVPSIEHFKTQFQSQIQNIQSHPNKFGFLFQIYHPSKAINEAFQLSNWICKERFMDADHLSFEGFLNEIEPNYYQTYLHHAHTAYRTVNRILFKEQKMEILPTQFTLRLPIKRNCEQGKRQYWWMYQDAFVFQTIGLGRVATHFNVYTFRSEYNPRNYVNNAGIVTLQPTILHYPDYQINKEYKKIFKEEFTRAFYDVCSKREEFIIRSLMKNDSRKKIAEHLRLKESTLRRIVIPQILRKLKSPYPLFPHQNFAQMGEFLKFFRQYDPFS